LSGFFQNRIVRGDFSLTAGVRIENVTFERRNRLTAAGGKTSLTEVIPGIGISYNLLGRATLFAGVHRGFAPPRTEDIVTNAGGVVDLDSELSWNYEAGVRTAPFRGVAVEAAWFRTDYSNQVVPASVAGGIGAAFTNGGATLHQGFELVSRIDSGQVFRTDYSFYFQVNLTGLTDAEFRGLRRSSISGFTGVVVTGNRLPYAPKRTLNAVAGFRYRGFHGFVENNFIGRQFSDDLNTVDPIANGQRGAIPAQTYWNATANYRVERIRSTFFVTVKNVADGLFIVDRSRGILPSAPRLVQTGVKIDFR
jgi:Fe(3+) dicitrate transport protein